jgi:DNA-directed RNA polymerase specialized sigma24 family protein
MNVDWTFDGCDSEDERAIETLWETFQTELESKTGELSLEPSELRLSVMHDSSMDVWQLQAALHLTTRTLVAENRGHGPQPVFDQTVADLLQAVDREGSRSTELNRRMQGLDAVLPLLEQNRAEGRSYQFFFFLGPLMRTLRPHVDRELELLELDGTLAVEDMEADEVLDEALLRAWYRFPTRPRGLRFDLWLIGLVDGVLDGCAKGIPHESLEAERDVALPEEDEQTSPITWVEQAAYPETIELGDLLPGEPGVDIWDQLDLEAKQTNLAQLLSYLSRQERQLLVLHAVEGFEPEQIAALQDRPVVGVKADLKDARSRLAAALKSLERTTT